METLRDPAAEDSRFFTSATAPDADGTGLWRGADLLVVVLVLPAALVVLEAADLAAAFGLDALAEVAVVGFRGAAVDALPRFSAKVSCFEGE